VEILEDRTLLSPYLVTTTVDSGPGSLRDAITQVNADTSHTLYPSPSDPSRDEIDFQVTAASDAAGGGTGFNSATGVATFTPQSTYPTITNAVLINGYTQPGAAPNTLAIGDNATLKIQLDFGAHPVGNGIYVHADHSTIRGLVLNDFVNSGNSLIQFYHSSYVSVEGNFIGTDVSGISIVGMGPGTLGVGMDEDHTTIGGTTPDTRNVIAGCGVGISDGAVGTLVEGNYIGTDVSGTKALGNGYGIESTYPDTIVGNLISGNNYGIAGSRAGAVIQGNLIGTDATGTTGLGNVIGINVDSGLIGGTTAAARNIISGNSNFDISGGENPGLYIEGNYIGTEITGMHSIDAVTYGIYLLGTGGATIGGLTGTPGTGAGNLIAVSGNAELRLQDRPGDVIEGNLISNLAPGIVNIGTGILMDGSHNVTIGGADVAMASTCSMAARGMWWRATPSAPTTAMALTLTRAPAIASSATPSFRTTSAGSF
jgi:hypothetical protein